ncbi:hypothetical protein [Alloactinosynnema sp. L-07]|uniref:hypothetical protein n=1 Tax=Alloactinosynnema sp. L-07 TaxID=1653480 RepID=UPI00065EF4FE|nr:hypothetical protein [Alloactinosynnema sp. L-07]CRK56753.1 hypothetical protein [Alloactinosynnema sp. L-07]
MKKLMLVLTAVATLLLGNLIVAPAASATVHEIVAQWCSGKAPLDPAGLSRPGSKNFAQPLFAGGVVSIHPYADGLLVDFDFDRPQTKIVPTGQIILVDTLPDGTKLYLEAFTLDPNFPAFANCPALANL